MELHVVIFTTFMYISVIVLHNFVKNRNSNFFFVIILQNPISKIQCQQFKTQNKVSDLISFMCFMCL